MKDRNNILIFLLSFFAVNVFSFAFGSEYKPISKEEMKAVFVNGGYIEKCELDANDLTLAVQEAREQTGKAIDIIMKHCKINQGLRLDQLGENKIKIIYSVFNGDVMSFGGSFMDAVDFSDSKFMGKVYFSGSNFSKGPSEKAMPETEGVLISEIKKMVSKADRLIDDAQPADIYTDTNNQVNFNNAAFFQTVNFDHINFSGNVDFGQAEFFEDANFSSLNFSGRVNFTYAEFKGKAFFYLCDFLEYVSFAGVNFNNAAQFWDLIFQGQACFTKIKFSEEAQFLGGRFLQKVDFSCSEFFKMTRFQGVRFEKGANFRDCNFKEEARFLSRNRGFYPISGNGKKDIPLVFNGDVNFTDATFNMLNIEWKAIKGRRLVYSPNVYPTIIKSLNELGRYRDADDAFFEFRSRRRKLEPPDDWYSKYWEFISEKSCGYGVKPFLVLQWWFGMVMLFSLFFSAKGALRERIQGKPSQKPYSKPLFKRVHDAVYFSVSTFTKIGLSNFVPTDNKLIRFPLKIPLYSIADKKWKIKILNIRLFTFRFLALAEGILGWMLMALFLVCLGKVYIR